MIDATIELMRKCPEKMDFYTENKTELERRQLDRNGWVAKIMEGDVL